MTCSKSAPVYCHISAPSPIPQSQLPLPGEKKTENLYFEIQVVPFDETNGKIA